MTDAGDPMDPMSARARSALEHFRAAESLDDAARARISNGIEARLAVSRSEHPTTFRAPRRFAPKLVGGAAGKAVLGFVLAAAAAWGAYETVHERSDTQSSAPAPSTAALRSGTPASAAPKEAPAASVRLDEHPLAAPVARDAPPNSVAARPVAPDPTPTHSAPKLLQPNNATGEQAPSTPSVMSRRATWDATSLSDDLSRNAPSVGITDEVAEEVALLKSAQAAINAGRPAEALSKLAEHARRFPHGKLNESCEVARIVALCDSGQKTAARAAADRFLAARPSSPFASRVRTACAPDPASP